MMSFFTVGFLLFKILMPTLLVIYSEQRAYKIVT